MTGWNRFRNEPHLKRSRQYSKARREIARVLGEHWDDLRYEGVEEVLKKCSWTQENSTRNLFAAASAFKASKKAFWEVEAFWVTVKSRTQIRRSNWTPCVEFGEKVWSMLHLGRNRMSRLSSIIDNASRNTEADIRTYGRNFRWSLIDRSTNCKDNWVLEDVSLKAEQLSK